MRWLLLIVLTLDVMAPLVSVFALVKLMRRSWPGWKAYGTVSTIFAAWTLIVMHGVGHNLTSYLTVVPIAIALGAVGLRVRGGVAIAALVVVAWVLLPTAISWIFARIHQRREQMQ